MSAPIEAAAPRGAPPFIEPKSLFGAAWDEGKAVARYRHLVRYIVSSSLRTENTGTVFGFLWWLLHPLLLMAVYTVLVDVILKRGEPDFPIFVLTAILSWEFFTKGVRTAIGTTLGKETLMRQVAFPRSVLPLASTIAAGVHFIFGLGILVVFAVPFGIRPHPIDALVLIVGVAQLAFTLGVAFFLSALNIFFRDTSHLSNYVFRVWFYLSPALYDLSRIPDAWRPFFSLNPFTTFFTQYRTILLDHRLPDFRAVGYVGGASVVILTLGFLFYVRLQPLFTKVT